MDEAFLYQRQSTSFGGYHEAFLYSMESSFNQFSEKSGYVHFDKLAECLSFVFPKEFSVDKRREVAETLRKDIIEIRLRNEGELWRKSDSQKSTSHDTPASHEMVSFEEFKNALTVVQSIGARFSNLTSHTSDIEESSPRPKLPSNSYFNLFPVPKPRSTSVELVFSHSNGKRNSMERNWVTMLESFESEVVKKSTGFFSNWRSRWMRISLTNGLEIFKRPPSKLLKSALPIPTASTSAGYITISTGSNIQNNYQSLPNMSASHLQQHLVESFSSATSSNSSGAGNQQAPTVTSIPKTNTFNSSSINSSLHSSSNSSSNSPFRVLSLDEIYSVSRAPEEVESARRHCLLVHTNDQTWILSVSSIHLVERWVEVIASHCLFHHLLYCQIDLTSIKRYINQGANINFQMLYSIYSSSICLIDSESVSVDQLDSSDRKDTDAISLTSRRTSFYDKGKMLCTPLLLSLLRQSTRLMEFLLQHGASCRCLLRWEVMSSKRFLSPRELVIFCKQNPLFFPLDQMVGDDEWQLTLLMHLCLEGDEEGISILLSLPNWKNFYTQATTRTLDSALTLTLKSRHASVEAIALKLLNDSDLNRCDGYGETPLHLAIKGGYDYIAQRIIELNADVNAVDSEGNSAAHLALKMKSFSLVAYMLTHGRNLSLERRDRQGNDTLLTLALKQEHSGLCYRLLELGASPNVIGVHWNMCTSEEDLKNSENTEEDNISGITLQHDLRKDPLPKDLPIHISIKMGLEGVSHAFLEAGAAVDRYDTFGSLPVTLAMRRNMFSLAFRLLLDRPSNSHPHASSPQRSSYHDSSLTNNLVLRSKESVKQWINQQDEKSGENPLLMALRAGQLELSSLLLDAGADCNGANNIGETPLHLLIKMQLFLAALCVDDEVECEENCDENSGNSKRQRPWRSRLKSRSDSEIYQVLNSPSQSNFSGDANVSQNELRQFEKSYLRERDCIVASWSKAIDAIVKSLLQSGADLSMVTTTTPSIPLFYHLPSVLFPHHTEEGTMVPSMNQVVQDHPTCVFETPLHFAARGGEATYSVFCNLLSYCSCNPQVFCMANSVGDTPFLLAIRSGHLPSVRTFLNTANRDLKLFHSKTPMSSSMDRILIWNRVVNARNLAGETAMHLSIYQFSYPMFCLLLDRNYSHTNTTSWDQNGLCPIHLIIQIDADINRIDSFKGSSIKRASEQNRIPTSVHEDILLKMIKKLLEYDPVGVNLRTESGETPLMIAVRENKWRYIRILAEYGADFNAVTPLERNSVFHLAWKYRDSLNDLVLISLLDQTIPTITPFKPALFSSLRKRPALMLDSCNHEGISMYQVKKQIEEKIHSNVGGASICSSSLSGEKDSVNVSTSSAIKNPSSMLSPSSSMDYSESKSPVLKQRSSFPLQFSIVKTSENEMTILQRKSKHFRSRKSVAPILLSPPKESSQSIISDSFDASSSHRSNPINSDEDNLTENTKPSIIIPGHEESDPTKYMRANEAEPKVERKLGAFGLKSSNIRTFSEFKKLIWEKQKQEEKATLQLVANDAKETAMHWLSKRIGQRKIATSAFFLTQQSGTENNSGRPISFEEARELSIKQFTDDYVAEAVSAARLDIEKERQAIFYELRSLIRPARTSSILFHSTSNDIPSSESYRHKIIDNTKSNDEKNESENKSTKKVTIHASSTDEMDLKQTTLSVNKSKSKGANGFRDDENKTISTDEDEDIEQFLLRDSMDPQSKLFELDIGGRRTLA